MGWDGYLFVVSGSRYLHVPDGLPSASSLFGYDSSSSVGTAPDVSSSAAACFGCHSCRLLLAPSAFGKQTIPCHSSLFGTKPCFLKKIFRVFESGIGETVLSMNTRR